MASDLATALLTGGANAPSTGTDPAALQIMPQLTLAQSMLQQGLSGAPAYPAQALGRLAQALVGTKLMNDATSSISDVYGRAADSMSKIFPQGTPIGDMLRSPDPYVKMQGLQMGSKAALINSEKTTLKPGEDVVIPGTVGPTGRTIASGNPGKAGEVASAEAAAKAPYESGGTAVVPGGPSGLQEVPISAATRARMQPPGSAFSPVNPRIVNGQPQNLTGPIIPPGGAAGAPAARPSAPPSAAVPMLPSVPARSPESSEPTIGGKPVETPQYAAETKGREALYDKAQGALGGVIGEHIEAGGRSARDRLNALDAIESTLRSNNGKGILTGPHAESILHVKEALNGWGINTDWVKEGLPNAEVVQKMNAQLASASAKAMTGRPTQFEFQAWQRNNPGLMTSREGSLALLDILRQQAKQDIDIGKLAQNKKNWDNWGEVVDQYYADPKHHLVDPLTGKTMKEEISSGRSAGAGGVSAGRPQPAPTSFDERFNAAYGGRGGASGQPVRVSSPAEARKLPSGTPIILPDGSPGRVP